MQSKAWVEGRCVGLLCEESVIQLRVAAGLMSEIDCELRGRTIEASTKRF
jgi:hypothetical protein